MTQGDDPGDDPGTPKPLDLDWDRGSRDPQTYQEGIKEDREMIQGHPNPWIWIGTPMDANQEDGKVRFGLGIWIGTPIDEAAYGFVLFRLLLPINGCP